MLQQGILRRLSRSTTLLNCPAQFEGHKPHCSASIGRASICTSTAQQSLGHVCVRKVHIRPCAEHSHVACCRSANKCYRCSCQRCLAGAPSNTLVDEHGSKVTLHDGAAVVAQRLLMQQGNTHRGTRPGALYTIGGLNTSHPLNHMAMLGLWIWAWSMPTPQLPELQHTESLLTQRSPYARCAIPMPLRYQLCCISLSFVLVTQSRAQTSYSTTAFLL